MERLMQYIWEHRLYPRTAMTTVDGRRITVLDPGLLNRDAGPDFFNAKILIDNQEWVGNVEIHVRASDWLRHGHHTDPAYDSVILHVVDRDDMAVKRSDGQTIPQLRLPCVPEFSHSYNSLVEAASRPSTPPCIDYLNAMQPVRLQSWIDSLAYERLYRKSDHIMELLHRLDGDWESVCYVTLARALGFGINAEPMERLALSVPLAYIRKHSDSITYIEALLLGQSGLLNMAPQDSDDPYVQLLRREYAYLANKFSLCRPEMLGWKMARMRPANFPHRRIAYLSSLLLGGFKFMAKILDIDSPDAARRLFDTEVSAYWSTHYTFSSTVTAAPPAMTQSTADGLIINVVAPLLWAYGTANGREDICDRAVALLCQLKPENNTIVRAFTDCGIKCPDAFTSQALIQLRREYCEPRKCLRCRIGHAYLSTHAVRSQ